VNIKQVLITFLVIAVCATLLLGCESLGAGTAAPVPSAPASPAQTPPAVPTSSSESTPTTGTNQAPGSSMPAVGAPAPEFTLPSVGSGPISLSSFLGQKNVVLVFYRTGG
jgi:hypothetical protein